MKLQQLRSLGLLVAMIASIQLLLIAGGIAADVASVLTSLGIVMATLLSAEARRFFRRAYRPLMPAVRG